MRTIAIALLTSTLALLLGGAPSQADEYAPLDAAVADLLPEHTAIRGGRHPRYGPSEVGTHLSREEQRAAMREWAAAAETVALANPGTQLAADLLHGAAHVHARGTPLADLETYRRLALAAVDASLADDPAVAAVMLGLAREEIAAGNAPAAGRWLERLEAWEPSVAGWQRETPGAHRMRALLRVWDAHYLPTRSRWLESTGRGREAAEALARHAREGHARDRSRRWRQAAEAYARAGEKDEAVRAMMEAYAAATTDAARGDHGLWGLYAEHGLLDERGKPAGLAAKNGWSTDDAFRRSLTSFLGALGHMESVTTIYLELGSRAHLRGDEETALTIYLAAMDNPAVADEAAEHPDLWEGLLVAFAAAIELDRFDDAERILETVARIGSVPAERFDTLLVWLKNRRADAAQVEAMKQRIAEEAKRRRKADSPEPKTEPQLGTDPTLGVEEEPEADDAPVEEPDDDAPLWPWILGGLALLWIVVDVVRSYTTTTG